MMENSLLQLVILFFQLSKKYAKSYTDKLIGGVTGGLRWKGAVNYFADLPLNAEIGDAYTVKYLGSSGTEVSGVEYAWGNLDGTPQWVPLGPDIDISLYLKKADADKSYQPKGEYLTSVPQATDSVLGGLTAKNKTTESVEAAIDPKTGKMYVPDMKTPIDTTFSESGKAAGSKETGDALKKKTDKVPTAVAGNLAAFDENGSLKDSGKTAVSISVDQMTIKFSY